MTTYLLTRTYPADCDLNMSDQITVPADVWTLLDNGSPPIFVTVGDSTVGRLRPAVPSDELGNDSCILPEWMWRLIDSPDPDTWISIQVCTLPTADTILLRAREESSLLSMDDPVATLSAALSGASGPSWACLSMGAELPLACGVFDVMEIRTSDDQIVSSACILDCDVNLEIMPALDHRPPVPEPVPEPRVPTPPPPPPTRFTKGFVPFSGVGRRLCD